jgi:hypothetical protein
MWTVEQAIAEAEAVLPGEAAEVPGEDARWQVLIRVGEFVESDPEPLWAFVRRWGSHPDEDLRAAIAACVLEHLLQYHFATIIPRVAAAGRGDQLFADTFLRCWQFGQAEEPVNAAQFNALQAEFVERAV